MAAPCVRNLPVYNDWRGVENLMSGNRTRQTCGIFVPSVIAFTSPVNGREGREIPNTRRRSHAVSNLLAALLPGQFIQHRKS